ncbi:hypothetical protein TRFO_39255 [Tritrichomonas foetus]|uniref:Uncharacterized protein n=1 Tax=Tritrichomonas foetus TaxID=1144522 RepID=A0A1J4JA99_9EUKA|nr:hypothetical protein TRFO_39255 [Tritrichomonas foetus]|eukprot:OHS94563.1 hypothetical protein TRFO_39255 [Tritrichomonas foetus]
MTENRHQLLGREHDKRRSLYRAKIKRLLISISIFIFGILIILGLLNISHYFEKKEINILSLEQTDSNNLKSNSSNSSFKKDDSQKNHIPLNKKIQISVPITQDSNYKISFLTKAWASDFANSEYSGGFFYVTESQLNDVTLPQLIVSNETTNLFKTKEEKYMFMLFKAMHTFVSVKTYQSSWFLGVPDITFINIDAFEAFFEDFTEDPQKEKVAKIKCIDKYDKCIIIVSKNAAKYIIKNKDPNPENIIKISDRFNTIVQPLNISTIIKGNLHRLTRKAFVNPGFSDFSKCPNSGIPTSKFFMWFVDLARNFYTVVQMQRLKNAPEGLSVEFTKRNEILVCMNKK